MRILVTLSFIASFSIGSFSQLTQDSEKLQYFSPKDNSEYHNTNTCVVLRHAVGIDVHDLDENCFSVVGSNSGAHEFEFFQSADQKTLNFTFDEDFALDEEVSLVLGDCLKTVEGAPIDGMSWSFHTSKHLPIPWVDEEDSSEEGQVNLSAQNFPQENYLVAPNGNIAPGNYFISLRDGQDSEIAILDSVAGEILWHDAEPIGGRDFKLGRGNLPTYGITEPYGWRILDDLGQVSEFVTMWNGYTIDWHDFQHLENGHKWLFAYDQQIVDLSEEVDGGHPDAVVAGFVIQELDENDLLLLQWRSWDHLEITDNENQNLSLTSVDPFHINSIDIDSDSNILISMRHLNEVLKFNSSTGEIIWRWGINEANSQFEFLNDFGFSHQHDVRRLPNGNILMYDNANVTGQVSRAIEYSMDTVANTVSRVWQYIHPEQIFGSSTGGVQRMSNGNTLIYWGNVSIDGYGARFSEVDVAGNVLLEFNYPQGWGSYRVRKAEWMFVTPIMGCMDETAFNFDPDANVDAPNMCQYDDDGDGFTSQTGDCDDTDESINPDATDIPNDGIDQDCSGADAIDADGDGFLADVDCDDNDGDINPDAVEIPYDGIDQDCSGADLTDVDGDGFSPDDGDCDDNDSDINPDMDEIPYDGIDQDCSGADLTDVDGDGFTPEDGDCDDYDSDINPDADEIPYDGVDQDCSGADLDDQDNDGFSPADGDCDDFDEDINPDEIEIPNDGIDQDCDGEDLLVGVLEQEFPFSFLRQGDAIFLNNLAAGKWIARVFDASGRLVQEFTFSGTDFDFSIQNLVDGLYLITIANADSNHTVRIVK